MAIANLRVPITPLPTPDTSWLDGLAGSVGNAIDISDARNQVKRLTDGSSGQQQPGFIGQLFGRQSAIPAPAAQQQIAATGLVPVQGNVPAGAPNDIQNQFIGTVRNGGLTNPYGLAAVAATGRAESSWDPSKVNAAWPDPSQSGQAGTAGGILSWRNERLANLRNFAQAQGEDPSNISPATQAKFFLQEDPTLIQRLNAAKSPQEAASIMASAWKFAGYDQPGGEAARRAALAQNYYANEFKDAPVEVASLNPASDVPAQGDVSTSAPQNAQTSAAGFDPATATPAQLNAALGPSPQTGYVDPTVTTAYRQPAAAASAPPQAATAPVANSGPTQVTPDVLAAQGAVPINGDVLGRLITNPYTRDLGIAIGKEVWAGKQQGFNFVMAPNGDLLRTDKRGGVSLVGNYAKPQTGLGAEEAGLNLVYGQDANGNTVAFQALKGGGLKQVALPDGVKLTPGISNIDTGTGTLTINNRTGTPIANTPKDVQGEALQKAVGGETGKNDVAAKAALPAVEAAGNQMLATIDSLASDDKLPDMVGPINSRKWNMSAASERVQSKMDQINGQAFLQAYNTLRGGGQITEVEGQKATAAMGRLNTEQNLEDYKQALQELRDIVAQGISRARQKAGQSVAPEATVPAGNTPIPAIGTIQDGYRFKGGDPSQQENWEQVQ